MREKYPLDFLIRELTISFLILNVIRKSEI